jgi:DtxR family Mn-dependent transcriptional regulator
VSDLIDTTEMYLRLILELEEEGVPPLRARIAERLQQSGPTVSQTVARMERDALVVVEEDRRIAFTAKGRQRAIAVMRKHRLAELLLINVIGLEYEAAHAEACRWEHVISDDVERKIYMLLGRPKTSPYGNRIPGLEELDASAAEEGEAEPVTSLASVTLDRTVVIRRISEQLQNDSDFIHQLHGAGVAPGAVVTVTTSGEMVTLSKDGATVTVPRSVAALVFVS